MKNRYSLRGRYYVLLCSILIVTIPLFCQYDDKSCNNHYETAIKFTLDAPEFHPFTVSRGGDKVYIATSNLQYCAKMQRLEYGRIVVSKNVFRFANRPMDRCLDGGADGNVWYDSIGKLKDVRGNDSLGYIRVKSRACATASQPCPDHEYGGWTDLFPWGTSCRGAQSRDIYASQIHPFDSILPGGGDIKNPHGIGPTFYDRSDPKPAGWTENGFGPNSGPNRYFDWGFNNPIYSSCWGSNTLEGSRVKVSAGTAYRPRLWRCMTVDEWEYLIRLHKVDGKDSAWTVCSLQDTISNKPVPGVLFYPDDFSFQNQNCDTLPFGNYQQDASSLVLPDAQWHELERAGCVFLPATYYRAGDAKRTLQETDKKFCWRYWSTTAHLYGSAWGTYMFFNSPTDARCYFDYDAPAYLGLPVRLVQDVL